MRKQLRFRLLLWVIGCTLFFSCGALAAANSDDLGSTNVITDSSENLGERTAYDPFTETGERGPPLGYGAHYVLVADFGAWGGLWRARADGSWSQLTPASSNLMVAVSRGLWDNLVANFPGHGLYQYDGYTWTQLTPNDTVQALIVVDGYLYADYGTLGFWRYDPNKSLADAWALISSADANLVGEYGGKLVANFPGYGLYQYDGTTWTQLTPNDTVQDLKDGGSYLYADYGTLGLLKYNGYWDQISNADANLLEWYSGLVANFPGYGLYQYDGTTWTQLTPNDTVQALKDGGSYLYADYGTLGLWKYSNSASWVQISSGDANLLGFLPVYLYNLGVFALAANFPWNGGLCGYSQDWITGVWTWKLLTSNSHVTNMVSVRLM
jgi:hypothetical protein